MRRKATGLQVAARGAYGFGIALAAAGFASGGVPSVWPMIFCGLLLWFGSEFGWDS